jgi:hypothetical protein
MPSMFKVSKFYLDYFLRLIFTGHVKGGRTLRGQGRNTDESDFIAKRKRTASSEIEDNEDEEKHNNHSKSSDDEKPIIKKRRILKMEPSPEVSENES